MKPVLHIITTICRGGAENQLLVLAREQRLTGRGVSVLYLKGKPELLKDFENIGVIVDSSIAEMNFFNQKSSILQLLNRLSLLTIFLIVIDFPDELIAI